LVSECLRGLLCGPAFREWQVSHFIEVGLLSESLRRKSAHCQRTNERGGDEDMAVLVFVVVSFRKLIALFT